MQSASSTDEMPPSVAEVVSRIVLDGWRLPEPALAEVRSLDWGGKRFSSSLGDARVMGDTVQFAWEALHTLAQVLGESDNLRGKPLVATFSDGRSLKAEDGRFGSMDRVVGRYWELSTPARVAKVWVTEIHGMGQPTPTSYGNLSIVRDPSSTADRQASVGHYRLRGAYTYYLLKASEEAWFLVVDTGSESAPERRDMFIDMLTLQFVFGRAFHFNVFVGLDGLEVVALQGGQHGRDHSHRLRTQPTVPLDFVDECWAALLFERLSLAYRTRPELRFYVPLTFYLDALVSYSVEARYLALQVALESFAFWLASGQTTPKPVQVHPTKWSDWLQKNRQAIVDLGATPELGESLLNQITSIPSRTPASRVVERAFKQYGLTLTPAMAAELKKGRGAIVHRAAMFDERQERLDAYLTPIAVVRTMLVALVARVAGYEGAILGWTRDSHRRSEQADAGWWPVAETAREAAFERFRIEV